MFESVVVKLVARNSPQLRPSSSLRFNAEFSKAFRKRAASLLKDALTQVTGLNVKQRKFD